MTGVNCYLPEGSEALHGWMRWQVMKTDILVVPIILVSGIYDSAVTSHQATDKVQGLHNRVIQLRGEWLPKPLSTTARNRSAKSSLFLSLSLCIHRVASMTFWLG